MLETRKEAILNKILKARTPRSTDIAYLGGITRAMKKEHSCGFAQACLGVYSGQCPGGSAYCDVPDKQGWR